MTTSRYAQAWRSWVRDQPGYKSAFRQCDSTPEGRGRYRVFIDLDRDATRFPTAVWRPNGSQEQGEVTIWCSNDYLGTERLRITPTPRHNEAHVSSLVEALVDVWKALGLPLHNGAAR
jgi:7-keto-8-aminopelargonate synthetase-like enzyme